MTTHVAALGNNAPVTDTERAGPRPSAGGQVVLLTLAAAQFLMSLDSSVMNVSIATVAKDPVRGHPHRGAHDDVPRVGRSEPRHPEGDVRASPGRALRRHPLRERCRPQ